MAGYCPDGLQGYEMSKKTNTEDLSCSYKLSDGGAEKYLKGRQREGGERAPCFEAFLFFRGDASMKIEMSSMRLSTIY